MLVEKIKKDLLKHIKSGDKTKISITRLLIAALKDKEISLRKNQESNDLISDNIVMEIINKMIKQRSLAFKTYIDAGRNDLAEKETSKNSKELLRRLHVKEGERILQGAEAFLFLWKTIPKYKFLYNFFKLPIIFNLFSFVYEIIAFFLYLKNKKQLKN